MLYNIDPVLTADILHALRAMGHGDELVLCDMNFPAHSVARHTHIGQALPIATATAWEAARAILSVLPLDGFVEAPVARMEVVGKPDDWPTVQWQVQTLIDNCPTPTRMVGVERVEFYERAKRAFCLIACGERRFYGCFIFKKGVIPPP